MQLYSGIKRMGCRKGLTFFIYKNIICSSNCEIIILLIFVYCEIGMNRVEILYCNETEIFEILRLNLNFLKVGYKTALATRKIGN